MSRKVLVVDDDPLVLDTLKDMLEELGCEVRTAASGEAGLQALASDRGIEVLIADVNMPTMTGHALAETAQLMRGGLRVLLLSGREIDGRGFPILRKPFTPRQLEHVMERTTGRC